LSKDPAFTALIAQAPKNRLLNAYLPGSAFTTLVEQSQRAQNLPMPQMQDSLAALKGLALFVTIINEGVRIDSAAQYDDSLLGADQAALIKNPPTATALERLPEDTLLYALSQRPDLIWKAYKDGMESVDPGAFDEAMTSFENQFGFNPDVDLFPFLTGELAIAVVPDENSALAQSDQLNLGLALLAQSADDVAVREALDKFDVLQADTGATVETETLEGIEAHLFGFLPGETLAVYGAGQSWLTIATSPEVFAATYAPTASLANSAEHQAVWASFPSGTRPAFFVDMRGLLALVQDSDLDNFVPVDEQALAYLAPFRAIASGAQPFAQSTLHSTAIIFIEKPTE
jgi:hypothetical protein